MNFHYSQYNNMLLLALYTGMRIGEVLALTIDDINFDQDYGTIRVTKTLTKNKAGKTIVGSVPKTKNAKRSLHLDKKSKEVIERAINEMKPNKKNMIFLRKDGKFYENSQVNGGFKRICKNAGIKVIVVKHKKNSKTKGLASSAGVSALLGITEPALFGVNLKYRFPFFCALIGSGVAAAVAGLLKVVAVSLGSAGFLGFLSIKATSIPFYILCELISFAIAFALTYIYGKTREAGLFEAEAVAEQAAQESAKQAETTTAAPSQAPTTQAVAETIVSPLAGETVALASVNDPVFSSGAMGQGIAVKPSGDTVYSPVDGTVQIAFETGHAYGLKSDDGAEVLIHIGIDTVSMEGKGFTQKVSANQKVKKGDVLGTFDSKAIADAGLDDTTMIIITNTADYSEVTPVADGSVREGDNLLDVK